MSLSKWLNPLFDLQKVRVGLRGYRQYARDWRAYSRMPRSEILSHENAFPCLFDRITVTAFDAHYVYQSVWAMQNIKAAKPDQHVDIGSWVPFVGMLTTITRVIFIDIRPLKADFDNFDSRSGTILDIPYDDNSIKSLSCLHVAEHIGLGRYGDPLDPEGTKKAARELARVLAPGGNLYFSLPVGRPRVQFNAHRIHSPQQILDYFSDLNLVSFAVVTDTGEFKREANPDDFAQANYACGLFHFTKKGGA